MADTIDFSVAHFEKAESQDAARYFLIQSVGIPEQPTLPPLRAGRWKRDNAFARYSRHTLLVNDHRADQVQCRFHCDWRGRIQSNSENLQPQILSKTRQNDCTQLQMLPTEILEEIDEYLSKIDQCALRLACRSLFIRLTAPVAHSILNLNGLDLRQHADHLQDIKNGLRLWRLAQIEEEGKMTILRTGMTPYPRAIVPLFVCSFCIACHHEHFFSSQQLAVSPTRRKCTGAERSLFIAPGLSCNIEELQSNNERLQPFERKTSCGGVIYSPEQDGRAMDPSPCHFLGDTNSTVAPFVLRAFLNFKLKISDEFLHHKAYTESLVAAVRRLQQEKHRLCHCVSQVIEPKSFSALRQTSEERGSGPNISQYSILDSSNCLGRCRVTLILQSVPKNPLYSWVGTLQYTTLVPYRDALHPEWLRALSEHPND